MLYFLSFLSGSFFVGMIGMYFFYRKVRNSFLNYQREAENREHMLLAVLTCISVEHHIDLDSVFKKVCNQNESEEN